MDQQPTTESLKQFVFEDKYGQFCIPDYQFPMNHVSIAIIRKRSQTQKDQFDYLVIEENGNFKFFETVNIAIGGTFDFSSFKKQIIRYFNLPETIEIDGVNVEVDFEVSKPFKSSKRDPEATAYLYELSQPQIDAVTQQMEPGERKELNLKWVFEANLKSTRPWKSSQNFLFETESDFKPPKFSKDFRTSLKKIVEAKNRGKLVIFAGAGVSVDSQVPSWKTLTDELRNDLATDEEDFLKIAELYYDSRGEKEYHERVQQILKAGKTRFNQVHQKIVDLDPVHIITTNYDFHFEQILEDRGLPYSVIRADKDLPYSKGSSLFVKMHGDFGLRNIVLRQSDYDNYPENFSLILSFIRETFASKLVLFIGFSFSDPNLQQILKWVAGILEQDIQQPYLFNDLDSPSAIDTMTEGLREKRVRFLQYEPALDEYFRQVKNSDDEDALKQLSAKSQSVYKFLKVIQEFDDVSDSLENLAIENQFIHSLARFEEMGAIPPEVLCSITPFKLKQHPKSQNNVRAEFSYSDPFQLETLNEELLEFLKGRKNQKDEIDFCTYRDPKLSQQEQKIHGYLKLLYSSGVYGIKRKSDTDSKHFKLSPVNKGETQCSCPRCLHDRFELKNLIYALNSLSAQSACRRDFHTGGLVEAYGFLKTGQIIKAFYALEEVRRESLKAEKYMTYFIASYNQTLITPMLRIFYETNYSEDEAEKITEKIESVDLYKILDSLPAARDIKHCMRLIMENNIYKIMLSRMENDFDDIRKAYLSYKGKGYQSSGPVYWFAFQAHFFLTLNFYHRNLLFTDENYTFSKMAHLYLEGMVASYATSPRYGQRLRSFPDFFARVFIQYGYASDTTKLLKDYDIGDMTFEHGLAEILKYFEEFLESSVDRTSLFGDRVYPDVSYHALSKNSRYFRNRITRTFNNFLVLMMHVGLQKTELNRLIGKMIDFLDGSEVFDASNSHQHFSAFIKHHIKSIDDNNLQKLGFYILSDNIWSGSLIAPFCNALITVRKAEHIFDENFYIRLLRRIEQTRQWTVSVSEIIPFYALLKPAQQEKFSGFVEGKLATGKTKRWDLINKAYHWQMWNPDKNREIFQIFFDHVAEHAENFPEYQISDDGHPDGDNFQPWNDLIITVHMIYSYKLFDLPFVGRLHEKIPSKMFRWILKPDEFDYALFEMKWLLVFSAPVFLETLKGNLGLSEAINCCLKSKYDTRVAELFYTRLQ